MLFISYLFIMFICFYFFNDTATTEIYTYCHTLSLHDALPIFNDQFIDPGFRPVRLGFRTGAHDLGESLVGGDMEAVRLQRFRQRMGEVELDRKSTRLNSSH